MPDKTQVFLQNTMPQKKKDVKNISKKKVENKIGEHKRAPLQKKDVEKNNRKFNTSKKKIQSKPPLKKTTKAHQKNKNKKTPRAFIVKICTSKKSCGDHYGPFIWERICNEHNEKIDQDSFEKNGITYKKSACQGRCKRSSNVQVEDPQKKKTTQFSYMNPLKSAKLISSLRSGAAPENIKRL